MNIMKKLLICILFVLSFIGQSAIAWTVSEDIDPFTDKGNIYVSGQNLVFRCMNDKFAIYISFNEYLGGGNLSVVYRFDKQPSVETEFFASTDGTAVFVQNTNDFALDSMAADKLLIKVFDYRGVSYTKSIRLSGLPDQKITIAAEACDETLMPTRSAAPTPTLDKFSDNLKHWLLRSEPEVTMCLKGILNKLMQSNLEISPMRDNDYFDLIDEYFDTAVQGCSKTDDLFSRPTECSTFDIIDGDINEWRNVENVELFESSLIYGLMFNDTLETLSSGGEYTTTCGEISHSQKLF
ncbi:hypothetical protein N8935_07680 [Amylibacter sp.]|nr:hypothetical protein [Amylibacter sp.]